MGWPSANKKFYKKYRRKSNNKVVNKFELEVKEILAESDLGSWYHHNFWENENDFDISSSCQKIILPEDDKEFSDSNNTSSGEENFPEISEHFIIIDKKELQNNINLCISCKVCNVKVRAFSCRNPREQNKQIYLLVNQKIKEKNMTQTCYEIKQKISETHIFSPRIMDTGISFDCLWNSCGWQATEGVLAPLLKKLVKS